MDNYIVSARKYRPMTFDSVVGQSALTTTLKNAVKSGKLAHAYLFCGPRGVGKTTCARIFAKAINCMSPTEDGEACNHCESCISFNEQRSYNIFELDAASNNSVENIKTLMEQTRIPPQVGKYKVFIIDEVHMLSTQAFNAFLKTLEEPPAHVIFILATTEKHKILPTIISRCQIYDFERMTVQSIINHLKMVAEKENVTYEEEALAVIAEKADGGMRDALSIFDQAVSFCQGNITYEKVIEDLNVLDSNYYFNIIDLALENKVTEIMVLLNSIIAKGFDGGNLVLGLASHVRNVLMARDEQTLPLLEVSQQQKQKYQEQAKKCTVPFLYKALKIMNQCDINYRQSNNKRLLVELTLIQIAQITQPDDDTSAGLSPKRLKSLFKKLTSTTLSKPAVQVAGTESIPVTRSRTKQQQEKEEVAPRKEIKIDTTPQPSNAPKLKLTSLMTTFGSLKNNEQKPVEQEETPTVSQEEQNKFSDEDLQLQWMMMCNRMPESMV
ncbi:MAG: DNA polymerase III subunit gamma/tau, partial [Prevotella sp.]|nr:DNA polymerase III subunit gamma/tau [Prevotella sp.]